jgi:hypothetical protein
MLRSKSAWKKRAAQGQTQPAGGCHAGRRNRGQGGEDPAELPPSIKLYPPSIEGTAGPHGLGPSWSRALFGARRRGKGRDAHGRQPRWIRSRKHLTQAVLDVLCAEGGELATRLRVGWFKQVNQAGISERQQ